MNTRILLTLTCLLAAVSCGSNASQTASGPAAPAVPNVEVAEAVARDVPQDNAVEMLKKVIADNSEWKER